MINKKYKVNHYLIIFEMWIRGVFRWISTAQPTTFTANKKAVQMNYHTAHEIYYKQQSSLDELLHSPRHLLQTTKQFRRIITQPTTFTANNIWISTQLTTFTANKKAVQSSFSTGAFKSVTVSFKDIANHYPYIIYILIILIRQTKIFSIIVYN